MKRFFNQKNKIFRRILSFTLVFALVLTGLPADLICEDILEQTGLVINVKAEGELDAYKAKYSGNSHTFTSGTPDLSEYSQCFQDAIWAAEHDHDTINLLPRDGKFIFDANYNPIGGASAPFYGTISLNTGADDFYIEANTPIFDYVKDSAKLYKLGTTNVIPLNINRVADAGDTVSPLLAKHMVGSNASTPYEWKVILNSSSAKSYSGVIYEMTDGAKVNLTFTDNSSHTPVLDNNDNISSGSIIDNKESGTNYGILCGSVKGSSVLQCTYTKTNDDEVTFIGTGTAYCGGLIGEINNSTFELLSGSSDLKVDFQTAKDQVGFVCGHAEGSNMTLPTGYTISGSIDGNVYAGGIAGYCENTVVNYQTSSGTISLSDCEIKNGTTTGGVFGYYECDNSSDDILLTRTYSLTNCKVEGTGLSGGIAGEYKCAYTGSVNIDLDDYSMDSTTQLKTGTSAGGLFGKYTANGSVTITDSDTSNTHFAPPQSSVKYGGVIGEYVNSSYSNTLTLSGFTVNNLNCTSSENVGGVIGTLSGSTYVSVSGVNVTNVTADSATYFGGIVSTLDSSNAGSFIDLTGNFRLSMASSKTYKGGAIAGSFKNGVIRFAGVTDISGAQAENGYAQLVYENDETLVYAKGNGADANWTLKRNADTTASDLGQWGEVVRMFTVDGVDKNAEDAGIVSVANNKVTVDQGVKAITDTVSFAKCALNMQLNDGNDHGALCFAEKTTYKKSELLKSNLTVSGIIDLSKTGLLGLMRDGGNNMHLGTDSVFTAVDFFTGSITGSNDAEIKLATGETYGTYEGSSTGTGGKIYISNGYGHDAQGLFSFAKGAMVTTLKISGSINAERKAGTDYMYAGALFGVMTDGATLSSVNVTTTITTTRSTDGKFYIGGVAGVFDGKETLASGTHKLTIDASSTIKPTINLYGSISCDSDYTKNNTYVGGVLGLLKGSGSTKYGVSISSSEVSPTINIDSGVANTDLSYLGGMIGRVAKNETNERSITLDTVTMTNASVDTKAKHPGGLLGAMWERTNLTVDGLTITGSSVNHKYSSTGSYQSGLAFMGTGKWDINSLSISNTSFSSTDTAPASFGLIVNQAYSGDDGLYINLLNRGYTLENTVTVPTTSSFFDEIAADTKNDSKDGGDILIGGNGTGIVNINMNAANGTLAKIVDSETPANGTGTYQNQLYSQIGNLVANQNSRYYYNLDVMMDSGHTKNDGEKFLLWSVNQYAASNIKSNFSGAITGITNINLSGLSYYPIPVGDVTLPTGATITFGFKDINDYENATRTPDGWSRNPDDTGAAKSASARNQHYLMQTGLFTTVSSLSANTLTLTGDFGYVAGAASGALINKSTSGTVSLTGLTLNKLTPSSSDSYLLINYIDGTGDALPSLTVSNLRATNYNATGVTLPVANSLFGKAQGQNMTMNFSDIKLDARNGTTPTGAGWDSTAASNMDTAYGTSRSIFSTATFFTELLSAKTSDLAYNYAVEKDWNTSAGPREVTYGKEITSSKEYENSEKRYYLEGESDGRYTNPVSNSNTEFDFSVGFLPYVANYENKGENETYPVVEIMVNYKAPGITVGCGTYNDPYIITTPAQFETIADIINNGTAPSKIRLPNVNNADQTATAWHGENGDSVYTKNTSNNDYTNTVGSNNYGWNLKRIRYYLASAYYRIDSNLVLSSDFAGLGKPATAYWEKVQTKGSFTFHGVIVGNSTSKPTITIPNGNPLIVVANGAVVKNININVTAETITKTQDATGDLALYGYGISHSDSKKENAVYYGGVIGEIMGGDNIIDDVTVTYTGTTTLSGNYKHLIAEGGMVGCVVNGALIFRGLNSVSGRTVTNGGIYSNQFVGRVINGYAVYESISGRTGTAPDNYNKSTGEGENITKTYTYPIDTIDRTNTNKLDVNYSAGTVTVPDAQSLYILSLITQSIASTADTSDSNEKYGAYSPSYGYYNYVTGVARLGDYTDVGCGSAETIANHNDFGNYACKDSVNNYFSTSSKTDLLNASIPYIIYRYTKSYENDATIISKNYPARKMTFDETKFWDITLSSTGDFSSFDSYQAFRGIGSVGLNSSFKQNNNGSGAYSNSTVKTAFKVGTFNGNNKTIKLHISLPRYGRDQENYYHKQNMSFTQVYSGQPLDTSNYGHDTNLEKIMGLGLFDCVLVKNPSANEYQFQNIFLQGIIEDKVFNTSGTVITGTTDQTQLFCVGGVVGKRVFGNNYDLKFNNIKFNGLTITGAYSCGGLIGIDAITARQKLIIDNCNSLSGGISITGGYYGNSTEEGCRHGIGSFVGMTFWCRPYIDGGTNKSDIYASNVTTYYPGTQNRCNVGGLIGYTGSGAEIKNINLKGLGTNPTIGSSQSSNAAGFIGFSQATNGTRPSTTESDTYYYLKESAVIIENCTLDNISVKALNSAAGFLARSGNTNNAYYPKYIKITNCAVIGSSTNMPEIKAYGTTNNNKEVEGRYSAGGFIADFSINNNTNVTSTPAFTSVIENSYIKDYKIEGNNVGGIIGAVNMKPAYLRNLYVQNCDIITSLATANYYGNVGGIVGYSSQNLSGYNLKIEGVNFYRRSGETLTDVTSTDAAIIVGRNKSSLVDKFVGIGAYHTEVSKVPTDVVKTNGTNNGNFFVFADYLNTSATDITSGTGHASTFGNTNTDNGTSNATMPLAPYINTAPYMGMGTDEYITGDGASIGKAGEIYKDAKANSSNRRYTVGTTTDPSFASTETNDSTVLSKYINTDGTYTNGTFKISTASAELGTLPTGVNDFAILVINDDAEKANDITPFIKSYIRLVTNADKATVNTNTFSQYAYSCGNDAINGLYQIVISPCYYDSEAGRFVLGTSGNQGLKLFAADDATASNRGKYYFDSTKADSEAGNYQFSLIDVQFKDPTDSTKIAYHLYVPVYTKKVLTAEFSAVSMSATTYNRSPYASKIASEIAANRDAAANPSTLVESTNEWTTTFIRYTYPKNQISSGDNWNFDKSIIINLDGNFTALPNGTKLILVDPNGNSDKYYMLTLDGSYTTGTNYTLPLSSFEDASGHPFAPQNLSAILADQGAWGSGEGHTNDLYEDYYLSIYVPNVTDGQTNGVRIDSGTLMTHTGGGETRKANIDRKLASYLVLGDLFTHSITNNSFTVTSGDGDTLWDDNREMTGVNKVLKTEVTATVQIKNLTAGAYLANSDVYHAFYLTLTSHDASGRVSDIIYGITPGYV